MPQKYTYEQIMAMGQGTLDTNRYSYEDLYKKSTGKDYIPKVDEGFLDEWLPDWIKKGYNDSITGMAQQVVTGEKRFNLDKYDPGVLSDIGSAIAGFLMPADLAATIAGAGVASVATRTAAKAGLKRAMTMGSKRLINLGAKKEIADNVMEQGAKKLISGASIQAGALSTYTGLNTALRQQIEDNEINWKTVLTDSAKSGLAGAVGGALFGRAMGRGSTTTTALAQEAVGFGTVEPLLSGEMPEPQDYVAGLGVVLGIGAAKSLPKAIRGYVKSVSDEYSPNRIDPTEKLSIAEKNNIRSVAETFATQEWLSKQGGEVWSLRPDTIGKYLPEVRILREARIKKGKKELPGYEVLEEGGTKTRTLTTKEFNSVYQRNPLVRQNAEQLSLKLKESLKLTDDEFQEQLINIPLEKQTDAQLREINKRLFTRYKVETHYKTFTEHAAELPTKDMFDHALGDLSIFFKTASKAFKDEGSRSAIKMMEDVNRNKIARVSTKISELQSSPLQKIAKDKSRMEDVYREVNGLKSRTPENGEYVQWLESWAEESFDYAGKSGVRRAAKRGNYLPIIWKPEVRDALFNDFLTLDEKFKLIGDDFIPDGEARQTFNRMLSSMATRKQFSSSTIKILNNIRKTYGVDYAEAYKMKKSSVIPDKIAPFNNIENIRKYDITDELVPLLETDLRALVTVYDERLARRAETVKVFGRRNEAIRKIVPEIYRRSPEEARLIEESMDKLTGAVERDPLKNFNPRARKWFENIMAFEAMSKISLGTATVANLTQTFISTLPQLGMMRTVKGFIKLANPKFRKKLEAPQADFIREMLGEVGSSSTMRKWSDRFAKYSLFTGINKFNNLLSASTAKIAIDDYVRIFRKNPRSIKGQYAKQKLKKTFGISIEEGIDVAEKDVISGMSNFARNSQLQRDFLKEPLWASNPKARPFIMFKSFGYKQATLVKDSIKTEMQLGNPLIFLRLGLGGMAGGTFVKWAKEQMYSKLSGREIYNPKDTKMKEFIETMASVGTFGMWTDFMDVEDFYSNVRFTLTPPFLSDLEVGFKALEEFQKSVDNFGFTQTAFRRAAYKGAPILGSLPARAAERFIATEEQKRDSQKSRKGREKKQILEYMMTGKGDIAKSRLLQWNKANPRNPFTYNDIGHKAIYRKALEKRMKKIKEHIPFKA